MEEIVSQETTWYNTHEIGGTFMISHGFKI
jgi:hypothetical protein